MRIINSYQHIKDVWIVCYKNEKGFLRIPPNIRYGGRVFLTRKEARDNSVGKLADEVVVKFEATP